jgi:DNA-binding IclR family transcriptional regulator
MFSSERPRMATPEPSLATPAVDPNALAPSTDRTFALLELLSQHPDGLTVAEMTRMLGIAQNSVFRITKTLEARGYLFRHDRDKRYTLTGKLLRIAQPKVGGRNLVEEALPAMKRLRDETSESMVLSVRSGYECVLILQVPALHVMKVLWDMGTRTPLYNNASGKVFLAFADEDTRGRLIEQQELVSSTGRAIIDRAALLEHLLKAQGRGYTTDRGEIIEGIHCVAAPVYGIEGEVAASLCMTGPAQRMPISSFRSLGRLVVQAADAVSERLRNV